MCVTDGVREVGKPGGGGGRQTVQGRETWPWLCSLIAFTHLFFLLIDSRLSLTAAPVVQAAVFAKGGRSLS